MASLFLDSWDHYTDLTEKYDLTPGGSLKPFVETSDGRFTNGSLQINQNKINEIVKFVTTSNELIVGIAFKFDGNDNWIVRLRDNLGNTIMTHEIDGTGGTIWRGLQTSGVNLGSYVNAYTTNVWQYVEFRCKRDAVNGEVEVIVGGTTQVFSATGINTGATDFSQVFLRTEHQDASSILLDDMYIFNTIGPAPQNTFIGDVRVTVLRPKANGNVNNFTPSPITSANFDTVNEALHNQDTDFVEAGQLAAKEDYQQDDFVDIGFAPGTIYAVQTVNAAKKTDAGALKYKDQMIIGGVTFDDGTEVTATSGAYKMTTFIRDTDPSDSAAWTEAKVALTGSGYEITFREI